MNWERIKGGWKRMISGINGAPDELTDEELEIVTQQRDLLIAFLQENYGCDTEQAEKELNRFTRRLAAGRGHSEDEDVATTVVESCVCHVAR